MQTPLDQALVAAQADADSKAAFYETILTTHFFVPTDTGEEATTTTPDITAGDAITPLVLEHEEKPYLLLFDQKERMTAWAGQEIAHVQLPGYILAEMTKGDLYWAINVGTDHPHEFLPKEVEWLYGVVQKTVAAQEDSTQDDA